MGAAIRPSVTVLLRQTLCPERTGNFVWVLNISVFFVLDLAV